MLPAMLTVSSRVRMLLLSGKEFARSAEAAQDVGSSLVGKIPWRRACQPTPVFLPGESHGQSILESYRP